MKKKFLTVISATCAVLALTSCGGGNNTGKHPKITLYGIESLTLMQNGKELASASDISATFGKDFELTFKPNNQFAFINRLTGAGYKYTNDYKLSEIEEKLYPVLYPEGKETYPKKWIQCDPDDSELADSMHATPYVGYGNYIYPNDYALARDYAYTYDINTDGSATLKVKGEYFQRNLVISFDRGITGDNDYCCPVQQLGLSDIVGESGWLNDGIGSDPDNYIKLYTGTSDANPGKTKQPDSPSQVLKVEEDDFSNRSDNAMINDSLLRENATVKLSLNSDVPLYYYSDPSIEIVGHKVEGDEGTTFVTKDTSIITNNDLGDYFVNIPFLNDNKNEAILEKCDVSEEHPYGYKLKYEGGITITPKVKPIMTEKKGITVDLTQAKTRLEKDFGYNVDFTQSSFIGREYKMTSTFSVYRYGMFSSDPKYAIPVDDGGEIKNFIPTINLKLGGGQEIVLDAADTTNCSLDDWEVEDKDLSTGEDVVYHFYAVTNKKYNGWQLTVRFVESEDGRTKSATNTFNYWFNPTSYDSLKNSEGKYYSSIDIQINLK